MDPTFAMFLGFVVAALIILWAVGLLVQRYIRHKKANTPTRGAWVMLKPTPTKVVENVSHDEETESTIDTNMHNRAKQNGHYSQPIK